MPVAQPARLETKVQMNNSLSIVNDTAVKNAIENLKDRLFEGLSTARNEAKLALSMAEARVAASVT